MTVVEQIFLVTGRLVWPVRPNVEKVRKVFEIGGSRYIASLEFPPIFNVAPGVRLSGALWCQLSVRWPQKFMGSRADFLAWASSDKGARQLLEKVERVQNAFVDVLKFRFPSNFDIHCIRHFGPLDWPLYELSISRRTLIRRLGSATSAQFKTITTPLEGLPGLCGEIPFEQRTLQRAVDLSQCGYPTESVLLAAAVLDACVQRFLLAMMEVRAIRKDSATQLLRNVTTRRLATYLDAVLKLAAGRSLSEDSPDLFARLTTVNNNRNDAIHNGIELSRVDAYEACKVTHEVMGYLNGISNGVFALPKQPSFFA